MKNFCNFYRILMTMSCALLYHSLLPGVSAAATVSPDNAAQRAWDIPRRGVMVSELISPEEIAVLGAWNVNLVRWQLRWGDFPASPADTATLEEYYNWLAGALEHLDAILPALDQYGIKVVLDLHTPPGGRQHPGAYCRIFTDPAVSEELVHCWQMLASRYKNNDTIIAYDLLNEPVSPSPLPEGIQPWREQAIRLITAVRKIDPDKPIVFENEQWAIPNTLKDFEALPFENVIYSIHFYYPYEIAFQGLNGSRNGIDYPGEANGIMWNQEALKNVLKDVRDFQEKYQVPIYVGEFSCIRWAPGETRKNLLADDIAIFEEYQWPWTYHAFREWSGWSLEHNNDSSDEQPTTTPTSALQMVLEHFSRNQK